MGVALSTTASTAAAVTIGLVLVVFGLGGQRGGSQHPPDQQRFYVPAPKFYWYFGLLNNISFRLERVLGFKMLALQPKMFIDEAAKSTPSGAEKYFGPQEEYMNGVRLVTADLTKVPTSAVGRLILRFMLSRLIAARKNVMQYVVDHPEITNITIKQPVIVFGLPRTGSTLLYNLLAQDPNTRAPYFWEMYHSSDPMPPATKAEFATHPRRQAVQKRLMALDDLAPGMIAEMSKSHVMDAEQIDEELVLLMQQMFLGNFVTMCGMGSFTDWMFAEHNKKFMYIYMLRFIQALDSANPPTKHWTLKSPIHALFIGTLLEVFPDARIVITHRDLANVVPSMCKYFESMSAYFLEDGQLDRRIFGKVILRLAELITSRMKTIRAKHENKNQFFDVKYDSFIKDPIATVKGIYEHYGMEFSNEFEQNMHKYLKDNPQGKHGRAQYDALDYGLDPSKLREQFQEYASTYL